MEVRLEVRAELPAEGLDPERAQEVLQALLQVALEERRAVLQALLARAQLLEAAKRMRAEQLLLGKARVQPLAP